MTIKYQHILALLLALLTMSYARPAASTTSAVAGSMQTGMPSSIPSFFQLYCSTETDARVCWKRYGTHCMEGGNIMSPASLDQPDCNMQSCVCLPTTESCQPFVVPSADQTCGIDAQHTSLLVSPLPRATYSGQGTTTSRYLGLPPGNPTNTTSTVLRSGHLTPSSFPTPTGAHGRLNSTGLGPLNHTRHNGSHGVHPRIIPTLRAVIQLA